MSKWLALLAAIRAGELNQINNQTLTIFPREPSLPAESANMLLDSFNSPHPETASEPDPDALFDLLLQRGPMTYGAASSTLEWGGSRAWRAAAELRAAGRVRLDRLGRMTTTEERTT